MAVIWWLDVGAVRPFTLAVCPIDEGRAQTESQWLFLFEGLYK
jgi:hypothetical protein